MYAVINKENLFAFGFLYRSEAFVRLKCMSGLTRRRRRRRRRTSRRWSRSRRRRRSRR